MKPIVLTSREAAALVVLAVFGLVVPNGVFVYVLATDPKAIAEALANPVAAAFIAEAVIVMLLLAWLIRRAALGRPTGFAFVLLSLAGSMAFSVPASIYLACKGGRTNSARSRLTAVVPPQ